MNSFYLLISSSENKAWKKKKKEEKIQACTGFECLTSAIPVQSSANWANKPTWSCWWINVCDHMKIIQAVFLYCLSV